MVIEIYILLFKIVKTYWLFISCRRS